MKRSVSDDDVRDDDDRGKRHRGGSGFRTEIRMLVLSRVCLCTFAFIRSTPKSRPNNIIWVSCLLYTSPSPRD